jgi:archaemetzincin
MQHTEAFKSSSFARLRVSSLPYRNCLQGSAHLQEDLRAPPYLCPVDLRKLLAVTGVDPTSRYKALLAFCDHESMREIETFAAFAAWLRCRLQELREPAVIELSP